MDEDGAISRFRTWMNEGAGRRVCLLAAAGVLLLAAAIYALRSGSDEADRIRDRPLAAVYVCAKCGASGEVRFRFGAGERIDFAAKFPIDCPKCGASKSAALGTTCIACGKPFARPAKLVFNCPHCQKEYDNRQPE